MSSDWQLPTFDKPGCVVCDAIPSAQITMLETPHGFGRHPRGPLAKIVHTCEAHYNDVMNEMTRQKWTWQKIERVNEDQEATDAPDA